MYCAACPKVSGELLREVFAPMVRLEFFQFSAMLGSQPHFIHLVVHEHIALVSHGFDSAPPAVVISKANKIVFSIITVGSSWAPHIRMHLITEIRCKWAGLLLRDRIVGRFSFHASAAKTCFAFGVQCESGDDLILHQFSDCAW